MNRTTRTIIFFALFSLILNQCAHAAFLPHKHVLNAPAPVTMQATDFPATRQHLGQAHNVFLQNDGVERGFPLKGDALFHRVQSQLASWGHYTLVDDADHADLILRVHGTVTVEESDSTDTNGNVTTSYYDVYSARLTAIDPMSQATLATVETPFRSSLFGRGKTIATDVTALVAQYKLAANQPLNAEDEDAIESRPSRVPLLVFSLVGVGLMAGLTAFGIHELHKNEEEGQEAIDRQKQQACQMNPFFCTP